MDGKTLEALVKAKKILQEADAPKPRFLFIRKDNWVALGGTEESWDALVSKDNALPE